MSPYKMHGGNGGNGGNESCVSILYKFIYKLQVRSILYIFRLSLPPLPPLPPCILYGNIDYHQITPRLPRIQNKKKRDLFCLLRARIDK